MKKLTTIILLSFTSIVTLQVQNVEIEIYDEDQDLLFYKVSYLEGKMKNGKKEGKWIQYETAILAPQLRPFFGPGYSRFAKSATLEKKHEVIKHFKKERKKERKKESCRR